MARIDVDALLTPIPGDAPCGENLEYDPAFGEMERASEGKPEQQYGKTIVPAEDPDWRDLRAKSLAVLQRSRDLRAAVFLTQAAIRTDGFAGLRDGLQLIHGLVETHWDRVHPELDPDDDNDPIFRINALRGLADEATVKAVRDAPLVEVRGLGRYGLREIWLANGTLKPNADEEPPKEAAILAAFNGAEAGAVAATQTAVAEAQTAVTAIDTALGAQVGSGAGVDFTPLTKILRAVRESIADFAPEAVAEAEAEAVAEAGGEAQGQATPGAAVVRAAAPGEINSTDDVIKALDRIVDYYRREQPTSPVPLLLLRARRLAKMDFIAVLKELAPDGVTQAAHIVGVSLEEEEASDGKDAKGGKGK
ncbi:MAG: type VI secretion system protein TssA [Candidatus Competibacterales bacterium]